MPRQDTSCAIVLLTGAVKYRSGGFVAQSFLLPAKKPAPVYQILSWPLYLDFSMAMMPSLGHSYMAMREEETKWL